MNLRFYAMSAEDAVRQLKSDSVNGLSHKEARVRYGKKCFSAERDFFYLPKRSILGLLAPLFTDFLFWTFLLTSVVLAFFEETRLSWMALALFFAHTLASLLLSLYASKSADAFSIGFIPKTKVLRNGKLLLTDHRYVVRGDIVFLSVGDLIPFDARILHAERCSVSVYCGKDRDGEDRFTEMTADPSVILRGDRQYAPSERVNMLTAGSFLLTGSARVLVVETGSYTYTGALTGGVSLASAQSFGAERPVAEGTSEKGKEQSVLKYLHVLEIVLLLIALPLTLLSVFLSESHSIAVSFLTVLSLAVAAIPGWIVSLWDFSAIYTLRHMRAHKGACIRNADALQRLAETDVMFLFGKPMITDGLLHVSAVFSDGSLHFGKRLADPACAALTERALMMLRERERYPVSDAVFFDPLYGLYRKELLQYAAFVKADAEMLRIRYRALSYRPSAAKHPTEALEYEDTVDGSRHILLCSPDDLLFIRCTHWYKNGKLFPMTFEKRSEIKKELHACIAKGCVVRSYAERAPGEEIVFLGFIACSERIPKGTREGVTALNASGVRTVLCMRDESSENLHYALSSGCARTPSEVARASEFRKQNRAVTDGFGTYTAYLGFLDEEIMMLLSDLSTHGIRTCGIALERSDEPLLRSTALMLACGDESNLSRKSGRKELTELPVEGLGCAKDATGRMRLCSDGLVRRAGSGGGIPELYQAVRSARTLQRNRRTLISYLLYSFSVRFGIALPALWGLSDLSLALSSLFVGLILDLCMGALIVMNAREGDVMSGGEIDLENTSKPLKRIAVLTVSGALSGTVLSLLPFFFPMIGIAVSAAVNAAFRTCAAIGLSLSFFLRLRHKNTGRAFDIPATVLLSGTVLAVIASFLFPAFGALIGIPAFPESAMLFWPIALLLPWILPFRIR